MYVYVLSEIPGDNVDCWMEIQHGKGPWAPPVSGIVPLGSTLTLVVAINDYRGKNTLCAHHTYTHCTLHITHYTHITVNFYNGSMRIIR